MASKNARAELTDSGLSLRKIERYLRFLTWQMFGLIALLVLCLASWLLRPQPGRYQYIGERGKLIVVDTGLPAALTYELEAQAVRVDEKDAPPVMERGAE
jgi:hypothetical protein